MASAADSNVTRTTASFSYFPQYIAVCCIWKFSLLWTHLSINISILFDWRMRWRLKMTHNINTEMCCSSISMTEEYRIEFVSLKEFQFPIKLALPPTHLLYFRVSFSSNVDQCSPTKIHSNQTKSILILNLIYFTIKFICLFFDYRNSREKNKLN